MRLRPILVSGTALLVLSAPSLYLMGREVVIDSAVDARYAVERIISLEKNMAGGALKAEIGGHRVELVDDQPYKEREPFSAGGLHVPGFVQVVVDGRGQSTPVAATIRVEMRDANRYWGYVYLQRLVDREGPERLVVSQHLRGSTYRTVSVFPDGRVVEDEFGYEERCSPPVRALLIRQVVPHPSGYCSDVLQVWPSIFYPVLYPWLSGAIGFVLIVFAGAVALGRRSGRRARLGFGADA